MTAGAIIGAILAAAIAGVVAFLFGRMSKPDAVPESEEERKRALAAATSEADAIKRQALVEAKEGAQKIRSEVESDLRSRRQELDRGAAEIRARVEAADRREREMKAERETIARKEKQLLAREQAAETVARTAASAATEARARLEKIAGMGEAEARKLLASEVAAEARASAASEVKRIEEEAQTQAKQKAQLILGVAHGVGCAPAVRRYEGPHHRP
jgi:ribonuclease Y